VLAIGKNQFYLDSFFNGEEKTKGRKGNGEIHAVVEDTKDVGILFSISTLER